MAMGMKRCSCSCNLFQTPMGVKKSSSWKIVMRMNQCAGQSKSPHSHLSPLITDSPTSHLPRCWPQLTCVVVLCVSVHSVGLGPSGVRTVRSAFRCAGPSWPIIWLHAPFPDARSTFTAAPIQVPKTSLQHTKRAVCTRQPIVETIVIRAIIVVQVVLLLLLLLPMAQFI